MASRRYRLPVQLTPYAAAAPRIGHNGGPALDVSWEAWLWRKSHAQAWKPPPRAIALHRLKRAERLGLDYRSYAGVLMNRGTHLGAAIFLLDGLNDAQLRMAAARIADLSDCRVLLGVPGDSDTSFTNIDDTTHATAERGIGKAIDRFILKHRLTPSGTFMVGTTTAHLRAAEDSALALFLWAKDYFRQAN